MCKYSTWRAGVRLICLSACASWQPAFVHAFAATVRKRMRCLDNSPGRIFGYLCYAARSLCSPAPTLVWGLSSSSGLSPSTSCLIFNGLFHHRSKTGRGNGNPLQTATLIKRKVVSCTQQMVCGEWIRDKHERCTLLTHVLKNKVFKRLPELHEFLLMSLSTSYTVNLKLT